jgi:hypothetical protein
MGNSLKKPAKIKPEGKVIDSITELMLSDFIVCLLDKDYSSLAVHRPSASQQELQQAWNKIYGEYLDGIVDSEQAAYINLSKEVVIMETRIEMITACLGVLSFSFDQEILDNLRAWTPIWETFDPTNPQQYNKDIESVEMRINEIKVELRQSKQELAQITPETEEVDRFYFEKVIVQLEKHKGPIDKWRTTVANFVFSLRDLRLSRRALQAEPDAH